MPDSSVAAAASRVPLPRPVRRRLAFAAARGVRPAHLLMLSPTLLLLLMLLALPTLYVGWLSLSVSTYGQDPHFVGLANYAQILSDRIFWRAFLNTICVVAIVVHGELLLGLGLAVLLSGWMPGKRWIIAVIVAPYAISETSGIVMWRYLLEPDVGLISQTLTSLGLGQIDWNTSPVQTLAVASMIAIWHHLPFTFLILYSALTTMPKDVLEAAEIDGAGAWTKFHRVVLPMIMPALLVAALFRTIFAIRMFAEVWLLTEGGPARLSELLAIYLYRETFKYHAFGTASATGWIMLMISLAVAAPYLWRMYRELGRHA